MWHKILFVLSLALFLSPIAQAATTIAETPDTTVTTVAPATTITTTPTTTTTTTRVIVTPVPEPKEVVVVPQGYQNCFTVAAGWYQDTWIPEHQVCQYSQNAQGVVWIQGYWACNKYNANNDCTNWVWKAGRWVKTFEVY